MIIRDIVRACERCQERKGKAPESPLHPWQWPSRPWERVHIDYCEANGRMFLILVDAHSKWIEVYPARSLDSVGTIDKLRMSFASWGIPNVLVSDNAQCFVSKEFETFCQLNGVKTSHYPVSFAQIERVVRASRADLQKRLL